MADVLKDIADFVFINQEPKKADIIFVPGGSYAEPVEKAAQLYAEGFAPYILPSGKFSVHNGRFNGPLSKKSEYNFNCETEWEFMSLVLQKNGVPESAILKEAQAVSTYDNARFSKQVTDNAKLDIKSAIICCKSIHARRAFMYYQFYYDKTQFTVCGVDIGGINKQNFASTPQGLGVVFEEMQKCATQFAPMYQKKLFNLSEKPNLLQLF